MPRSSWDNPLATQFKATTFGHQFGARLILAATKLMTGLVCKVQDPAACWQLLQFILVLLALEDFGNLPFANSSSSSRCGTWNPRAVGHARPTWSCRFWQTNILGSLSNIIPECLRCNFGAPSQIENHQVMGNQLYYSIWCQGLVHSNYILYYASVTFIDPVKVNGGKRCVGVNLYLRHEIVLDFYCLLF